MKDKDISRQTLVVLVFLAIVVSLLGTFTVLQEVDGARIQQPGVEKPTTGQVTLNVANVPEPDSLSGRVTLNVQGINN